jgi:general secretion pathway protein K
MRGAAISRCIFYRRDEAGIVLVAVLWILAALATLASIYSAYAVQTVGASYLLDDRLQAEASIRAGIEMTVLRFVSAPEPARPSQGGFNLRIGRTRVAVRFRSEAARIDLNAAPPDLLAGLFAAVGVDRARARIYADRIVGWRTKFESDGGPGAEEARLYTQSGSPYPPRQAPFDSPLELSLLIGMPMPAVERALPFVTVFSGRSEIDVASADPTVLSALPGMTPEIRSAVLRARAEAPNDRKALLSLLGPAKDRAMADSSKNVRSIIEVAFDNGRRVHAELVFRLKDDGDDPYDILSWRDDFDGPTPLAWDAGR